MNLNPKLRWGILGAARINERLMPAIVESPNAELVAIASRRAGASAQTLAQYAPNQKNVRAYDDLDAVRAFARAVNVVTFEFENVPTDCVTAAAEIVPVHPNAGVLRIAQHRLREKTYLAKQGFPVAAFRHVRSEAELNDGWILLFDGESLYGWEPATKADWQVVDGSRAWFPGLQDVKATIRTGAFGAFYLEIEGQNNSPRVRRVQ